MICSQTETRVAPARHEAMESKTAGGTQLSLRSVVKGLCPPILWGAAKKVLGPPPSAENRELARLWKLPRYSKTTARLLGRELRVTDGPSFAGIFHTYFNREQFRFPIEGESPLIIDGGANAGLSVLYWKHLSPEARVLAFEPDPGAFAALTANCGGLRGVTLKESALWTQTGSIRFTAEGSDGGHLSDLAPKEESRSEIEVQCTRLRDLLVEPVELLKLDIEGAEIEVLQDCAERLACVKWLFVEYHGFLNKPQHLGHFFSVIESAGFRIYCRSDEPAAQPFVSRPVHNGKELHLDVFAFRAS